MLPAAELGSSRVRLILLRDLDFLALWLCEASSSDETDSFSCLVRFFGEAELLLGW